MSRQLRHNLSDPAIRSALAQAVNGATPLLESSPRLQSAPASHHGGSAPDSPAGTARFLQPTNSSRLRQKYEETLDHSWRPADTDENSQQPRGRRRGDRPFLYVPTLHAKPIPLRGGGRGGATESFTVTAQNDEQGLWNGASDTTEESSHIARFPHQVRSASSLEAHAYPAVCSISTPVNTGRQTPVVTENGQFDFHEQIQSTRSRLASLEAEQRQLIDTSLGALVKAACAMSTPGKRDSLPSVSTFTCRASVGNGSGYESSFLTELPAETTMMLSQSTDTNMERLEDENRLLREAISRARKKNDDIIAKCKEAETRSKLLQEENMCAAQKLSTETGAVSSTDEIDRVDDPTRKEAARRDLLHLSSTAGKALEDLFARRANLQAILTNSKSQ